MSIYELLLFVHVLGASAWVGANILGTLLYELAMRAGDRRWVVRLGELDDRLAPILYIPAASLVLLAGIGLVLDGPWSFGDGWVVAGLVLLFAAFAIGLGFFMPLAKKLAAAVADGGADSPEVDRLLRSLRPVLWADVGVLVAAVFVMTTKPF